MARRRTLILSAAVATIGFLSGCSNPESEPVRKLSVNEIAIEETAEGWQVSVDVINIYEARDEVAEFHGVEVLGYGPDQTLVCSEHIGNVTAENSRSNPIYVEMSCSTFPTMITFDAAESPCDEEVRTVIKIFAYDNEYGWQQAMPSRECGEGLPPEPRNSPGR